MNKHQATEDELIELSKLRWHCRRGVKELDVVFTQYLENYYLASNQASKQAFRDIMCMEDPLVMDLIMEQSELEDKTQNEVLHLMRQPKLG